MNFKYLTLSLSLLLFIKLVWEDLV